MSRFGNLEFKREHEQGSEALGPASDASRCLRDAEAALRAGDFEGALRSYAKVLEFDPGNVMAWAGQARMLIELGDFEEARVWADKALERFADDPEILATKAVILARTGDTASALSLSDAAVEEARESAYVWLSRGDVLLARKEKRADYCFNRALAAGGGDWLWPWLASRVHYYYQRFTVALKLATQAMALDGCLAVVWAQTGRCQYALGLGGPAEESLSRARELDPRSPEVDRAVGEVRSSGPLEAVAGLMRRWFGR